MKDTLKYLVELQEIDRQLFEIEERKGSLPQKVEKLESEAGDLRSELENTKSQLEENQKELTGIKGGLMDAAEKIKKYQDQLYLVNTNREYDALTNEIETEKGKMAEMEGRQLELEEDIEKLESAINSSEEQTTAFAEKLEANRDELKEKSDLTDARQLELEKERAELAPKVRERYLRKYERILQARRRAVVTVDRSACSGCHKQLSPQTIYEIQQMDRLIECENCGRILVHASEDE